MKTPFYRTKCSVKLQQSKEHPKEFRVYVEAYPIYENPYSPAKRKTTFLNRTLTTVVWDKSKPTRGGGYLPKKNASGEIVCKGVADQQTATFAAQVCAVMQEEYNKKALFPEQYKEQKEQNQREQREVLPYIHEVFKKKQTTNTSGTMQVWANFLKKYQEFENGNRLCFGQINRTKIEEYIAFIAAYTLKNGNNLAAATQKTMIACFQTTLNEAYKDEFISFNPNNYIKMPKGESKHKNYLTLAELKALKATDCEHQTLKNMFLFSALTGLRYSDCVALKWENIADSEKPFIKFTQQKTKSNVVMPISQEARTFCGERQQETDQIFKGCKDSKNINTILANWVNAAEINKKITFHCARHTFATLQLTNGTDIYTVSQMLGHADIRTTQIYAKITDEKKQQAAQAVKIG